jgi:hypothetical protein
MSDFSLGKKSLFPLGRKQEMNYDRIIPVLSESRLSSWASDFRIQQVDNFFG